MIPVVILAGGKSRRMGGQDKGLAQLAGRRMVDVVLARLWPQCHRLYIAGPSNYGLGLPTLHDAIDIGGPAAGVIGAAEELSALRDNRAPGMVCAPVDGPNLPPDLVSCLTAEPSQCAIAVDDVGEHPTFAYWTFAALENVRDALSPNPSLRELAFLTKARAERWPGRTWFANINTPEELKAAH